jgi:hypothetical protein
MFLEQDALVAASNQNSATKNTSSRVKGGDDISPALGNEFSLHDFSANVVGNGDSDMDSVAEKNA